MPPQAPPPGPPGDAARAPYPSGPPGPGRPSTAPFPGGPATPPPRPPVPSVYGAGGRAASSVPARRSRMAVVAVVLAVLCAPVGFVLGLVARRRITASAAVFDEGSTRLTGRPAATAAVVVGALLTLIGAALVVGSTVGIPTTWLPSSDVSAPAVQTQIEQAVGLPAGSVSCPGPLPATVGATITCTGTENGAPVNLKATVSSVQGRDVRFAVARV